MTDFASQPTWIGVLTLRPGLQDLSAWTDAERAAVGAHFQMLQAQAREGRLVLAGRSTDMEDGNRLAADTIGVTIFHAENRDAARALMDADPAIQAGVMTYRLHGYDIAAAREGLR